MILRRKKRWMAALAGVLLLFYGCQDDNSSLGESLVKTSFRNVITDTCTVDISTILVDSMATLGDSVCQVGHYRDTIFGEVMASYLAEFSSDSFTPDGSSAYTFDSLTLTLVHSGHYWGDTLTAQRIGVYPLARSFNLLSGETLYNHSEMEIEAEPLFTFSFLPRPGRLKKMEVRMPDALGKQFFEAMMDESEVFDTQEKFRSYFHGLALVPELGGSCVTGFMISDSAMYMKMYYHVTGSSRTDLELTFNVNRDCAYTHVNHDRTGTPMEELETGVLYATSSTRTGNRAFLQGLTGIYNSIEFPFLNDLMIEGDIVSIESATLYLYPARYTYGITNQLPSTLRLYVADENNNTEDQIYDSMGTTVQDGSLTVDDSYSRETYYSFDLTSFLQENLGTWGINRKKLFLILDDDDFVCTFGQVVFANDPKEEQGQTKLNIRYKTYDK